MHSQVRSGERPENYLQGSGYNSSGNFKLRKAMRGGGVCEKETRSIKSDPGLGYRIVGIEERKGSKLEPQEMMD